MSHLSLYRKFRPETFEGIVRQEHVVKILTSQVEKKAVSHAYLFTGPRGTGKTTIARIFARAVNCLSPVNGSPCGECAVCRALKEGSLDITEIDAASNNGVGEMRELREKVQYPPVTGQYKVYIIDEVHMLTDSAFNALLKTLEEPPAHVIFILATTEPQKIPATILSRCMRLDFKLIPTADLEKHLTGILRQLHKEFEPEAVAAIARAGAGSDRDMLSIAEACIVYSEKLTYPAVTAVLGAADLHETANLVRAMLLSDMPTAISVTERILGEGKSVGVLLKDVLDLLGSVTVAKNCKTAETLLALPKDLFDVVKGIADEAEGRAILRATEVLIKTENELRFASSPRIALEAAILRVSYPEGDSNPDALLVRIATLEKKLAALESAPARPAPAPQPAPAYAPFEQPPAPPKAEPSAPPAREVPEDTNPASQEADPFESYDFPTEEPVFAEAYFSDEPPKSAPQKAAPPPREEKPKQSETKNEEPMPEERPSAPISGDAEVVYAKFMRELRKTAKSGVLFTMCSDLAVSFEGETLILCTDSESIFSILGREIHQKTIGETLARLGIASFEVRLAGASVPKRDPVAELKKNFKDYPIEIK